MISVHEILAVSVQCLRGDQVQPALRYDSVQMQMVSGVCII